MDDDRFREAASKGQLGFEQNFEFWIQRGLRKFMRPMVQSTWSKFESRENSLKIPDMPTSPDSSRISTHPIGVEIQLFDCCYSSRTSVLGGIIERITHTDSSIYPLPRI